MPTDASRPSPQQSPPPQSEAGIDRAGTGHGGHPGSARRPGADAPSSERPGDEEGPTTDDGSQAPPDPDDGAA